MRTNGSGFYMKYLLVSRSGFSPEVKLYGSADENTLLLSPNAG